MRSSLTDSSEREQACLARLFIDLDPISFLANRPETRNTTEPAQTNTMQKITPFLWFNGQAEDAMNLYVSLFEDSEVINVAKMGDGPAFSVTFRIGGQTFMALNGGPNYELSPAFSIFVNCEGQEEVDRLWEKLTADGGKESRCGWLVDKFGVSWQIIPSALGELIGNPDPEKSGRALQAMMGMNKIVVQDLQDAFDGK